MARFARIDLQIRANRLFLANRFRVPELNPFSANRAAGAKNANCRFEAIRANRSHIMKTVIFCESIRAIANRFTKKESRESPRFALRIAGPSKDQIVEIQKKFPGTEFEDLLMLLRDRPGPELPIFSSTCQVLLFLHDKVLESVWMLLIQ